MRRLRRIKILATLGPASSDSAMIRKLFEAGADLFRINMSHASHDMMRERVAVIRALEEKVDRPIGILVDLQGPKLRVGLFANGGEEVRKGDMFTLFWVACHGSFKFPNRAEIVILSQKRLPFSKRNLCIDDFTCFGIRLCDRGVAIFKCGC